MRRCNAAKLAMLGRSIVARRGNLAESYGDGAADADPRVLGARQPLQSAEKSAGSDGLKKE
jgi:hypothetical protein